MSTRPSVATAESPSASPTGSLLRLGLVPRADAQEIMDALYGSKPGDAAVRHSRTQILAMADLDDTSVSNATFGKAKTADGSPALLCTMSFRDAGAATRLFDTMDQLASSSFPFLQLQTNDALGRTGPAYDVAQFSFGEVQRAGDTFAPVSMM